MPSSIEIPLQLVNEMAQIDNEETCLNFLYFRNSLKLHRSLCDDKIRQRLSSVTDLKVQCPIFKANLKKAHQSRMNNLKFCLNVLDEELEKESDSLHPKTVLKKEKQLLESEIIVESIVCDQSEILFDNKWSCDSEKPFKDSVEIFEHLEKQHRIKIHEPTAVDPFLDQYFDSYRNTVKEDTILGLADEQDAKLRQSLHLKMLNKLLATQQVERNTVYRRPRMCLFCSIVCQSLPELFTHMFDEHRFNIGLLDNLIFVDTFLNDLEEMAKFKKQCIFCNEIFRSGTCLRKHLKSKNHFKINGKDQRWDRFYLVNYVNLVKGVSVGEDKDEIEPEGEEVDEWEDLNDIIDSKTQCLFCECILEDPEACFGHMESDHSFNIKNIRKKNSLSFYEQMKLLNYLRFCQIHQINPIGEEPITLEVYDIPTRKLWDKPEFYFPVYEEDPLLTAIEEEGDYDDDVDDTAELREEFNNKIF